MAGGGADESDVGSKSTSFQNPTETKVRQRGKASLTTTSSGGDDSSSSESTQPKGVPQQPKGTSTPQQQKKQQQQQQQQSIMVKLTLGMKEAIAMAQTHKSLPKSLANALGPFSGDEATTEIPFATVCEISSFLISCQDSTNFSDRYYVHTLMQGSSIEAQAPMVAAPNPELIKRRKKLQARMANLEYNKLARNVEPELQRKAVSVAPMDVTEGRRVTSLVVNLIITMAACFAFGWFSVASIAPNVGFQAIAGVICMMVAAGAELYFICKMSLYEPDAKGRPKIFAEKNKKKKKNA